MVNGGMFDRIILGSDVRVNNWKWITHFGTCGATLIAQRWALTAAHCCNPTVLGKTLHFGSTQFDGSGEFVKDVKIVDFHLHAGFERATFVNDICLLQLSGNVQSNPNIAPACLPTDRLSDKFQGNCYIAGWGVLQEGGSAVPTNLQEARVPYVTQDR
jgi:secreted trypsin-like serine protease